MNAWPELIDREINYTMQRENIEDCSLHFCTVTKMDKDFFEYMRTPFE